VRYSRKRGVKGKPRISLIGRFGLLV
jgi:hypothetical protein